MFKLVNLIRSRRVTVAIILKSTQYRKKYKKTSVNIRTKWHWVNFWRTQTVDFFLFLFAYRSNVIYFCPTATK